MTSLFETAPERSAEVISRVPEHEKAGTCPPEKTRESAKPHAVTDPSAAGREARANEFVLNKGQLTETQKRGHVAIGLGNVIGVSRALHPVSGAAGQYLLFLCLWPLPRT